jgi:hypothetical protein
MCAQQLKPQPLQLLRVPLLPHVLDAVGAKKAQEKEV